MLNSSLPSSSKSCKAPGGSYKDVSITQGPTALQARINWKTLTTQKHFIFLSEPLHMKRVTEIGNKCNKTWHFRNIIPGKKTHKTLWCTEIKFIRQETSSGKPGVLPFRCSYQEDAGQLQNLMVDFRNAVTQLISFPFFIRTFLKNSFCSQRYHEILSGNASQSKSNLSSRGSLNFKKCKCGWHACHRSATALSYCKSHHCAFHIWNRKTCYACKTRGSFTSHISMLRRMNAQLQRPTLSDLWLKSQRPTSEL